MKNKSTVLATSSIIRPVLLTWLLSLLLLPVLAQLTTVQVKDINPGSSHSYPLSLIDVKGTLFFYANDGTHGRELWKSDGTVEGTVLVKDIMSGSIGSEPMHLTNVNGTLYFQANDGTTGQELYKSDGTAAGTVLVKDIIPGSIGSSPQFLTNVNGTLYFRATDPINGWELWKSDGTSEGTVIVKDINPGVNNSEPRFLTNVNGTLYFNAADGTNGAELWKSDGTVEGTVLVKDTRPGSNGSNPFPNFSSRSLTYVNGTLYFRADDGTNGAELWKSDGTSAGTVLVKDIFPGVSSSSPDYLTNVNGTLYFLAIDGTNGGELWKSDGTAEGTVLVKDIFPGSGNSYPEFLTNVDGTLYFRATDGTNGVELWKTVLPPTVSITAGGPTTFCAGGSVSLSAGTFSGYVWKRGTEPVGTNATYSATQSGSYTVTITDGNGFQVTSPPVVVTVNPTTAIQSLTPSQSVCAGQPVTVAVTAVGVGLTYQWYRQIGSSQTQVIPGATTASVAIPVQFMPGSYYVVVSGTCGPPVTSSTVAISHRPPTTLRVTSNSGQVCEGGNLTLSVVGSGPGTLTYRWRKDDPNGPVIGTGTNYTIQNAQLADAGTYHATLTSECASATVSANATVRYVRITTQPQGVNLCSGSTTLSVALQAVGVNASYQWRRNGTAISRATSPTLTVQANRPGTYTVEVRSSCGNVLSQEAVVGCGNGRRSAEEPTLAVAPNPARGGEIRCRIVGMEKPAFSLTNSAGGRVNITQKTDGLGGYVLTPKQALPAGVYILQASEGQTRLAARVVMAE